MKKIIQILPFVFIVAWTIFAAYYIWRARKRPNNINKYIFESIPQIFATIGILGTFMGIAYGLSSFDISDIENSIPQLLDGLKTVFYPSIAGIFLLIISSKFISISQKNYEKVTQSNEQIALNRIVELLSDIRTDLNKNYEFTNELSKKLDSVNSLGDLGSEIIELKNSLQKLSSNLEVTIDAGFENLLVQQEKNNTVTQLQKLQQDLITLSSKLDNNATEISMNVVKNLAGQFDDVVNEFKKSISESAKNELESITAYLKKATSALADFPVKYDVMSEGLNKNFKKLEEMLQQTAKETFSQSNESTVIMRKQIEEMNEIVKYFYTIYS